MKQSLSVNNTPRGIMFAENNHSGSDSHNSLTVAGMIAVLNRRDLTALNR